MTARPKKYEGLTGERLETALLMVEDRVPHAEIARTLNCRLSDIPAPALSREEVGYYNKYVRGYNRDLNFSSPGRGAYP